MDIAVFGAGCFWCIEAIFSQLNGVIDLSVGYTGGHTKNPSYEEVCSGKTGHAEVLKITFDSNLISYEELLKVFWSTHDPTTLNRQGNDIGTQYRSSIFYNSIEQKQIANSYKKQLEQNKVYKNKVVTEIEKLGIYYEAENYHQDYYSNNKEQLYCRLVIKPKIEEFKEKQQNH
ncbi:MAG: peptide-methionine (S)-S-oxide reductase [Candidatus Marinimicrobia bacterium]|nr:peptide-methionine (S)-S-oxide reductase [Candidatus Neomarinimicrobiota bacterium]|tara:strand:- start:11694 stop:12215 length:522 start_codon:yes stop_codon:yes gene_type:complete